jgi:hypothetical protein
VIGIAGFFGLCPSSCKMEALCSSDTSVDFHRTTLRYNPPAWHTLIQ